MSLKYEKELFANEIVLLAYYIATANIENAFCFLQGKTQGQYKEFSNISLTDTFQLYENEQEQKQRQEGFDKNGEGVFDFVYLKENSERITRQQQSNITVIVGNPPYSAWQKSANDNAQNLHYPLLEKEIQDTYAKEGTAQLKNSLFDSYIKAFKWATLRLDKEEGGVIGFVTNAGYIDSNAMDGLRKCFAKDFSDIYILNLRGAIRGKIGDDAKKEGGNIFGILTGVAITILVKNPKKSNCDIHYFDIGDNKTKEQKLAFLKTAKDIQSPFIQWQNITPNEKGDWINQRNEAFDDFIAIEPKEKNNSDGKSFFDIYSRGLASSRDAWVYNSNRQELETNIKNSIEYYNGEVDRFKKEKQINTKLSVLDFIEFDSKKFSWDRVQKQRDLPNGKKYNFDANSVRLALYRPFCKQHLYFNRDLNNCVYLLPRLFPTADTQNLVICLSCIGTSKALSCIITDCIPDLHLAGDTQCFPLYYYKEGKRQEGISDFILQKAKEQYGKQGGAGSAEGDATGDITKEDIFYYVYGFLHSKEYRATFGADLKKSLPRLPLVQDFGDFLAFSKAGRRLAALHLNYEKINIKDFPQCKGVRVVGADTGDFGVLKMKWAFKDKDKTKKDTLLYNGKIRIEGIPQKCQEYVVNGRSAIDWVIERYQVKQDKASGIVNDPNLWCLEQGKPRYILDLLLSVIALSVETCDIVEGLPECRFDIA